VPAPQRAWAAPDGLCALSRLPAADGDEGGRHQLIKAAVNNGYLYIIKIQIGDKRWFKGAKVEATGAAESFTVA
jgi:hypothetical protein